MRMNVPHLRVSVIAILALGLVAVIWTLYAPGAGRPTGKAAHSERREISRFVARREDSGPGKIPAATRTARETREILIPGAIGDFERWLSSYASTTAEKRPLMLDRGRTLLVARRKAMAELINVDPEAAILTTIPPAMRKLLPVEFGEQLEKIVATEGFYGVKTWCNHGTGGGHDAGCRITYEVYFEGRSVQVSIYGSRKDRLSEENASIYGVWLDDRMALHEDDVVVLPASDLDSDPSHSGQWALVYKGRTTFAANEEALPAHITALLAP